jgi:catechol 2,3-dioxygenase-like lactoylglutathione lyase family enzyme
LTLNVTARIDLTQRAAALGALTVRFRESVTPSSSSPAGNRRRTMTNQFPAEGMELTHLLVVSDLERSRGFYRDVLGAELYREYGGTSVVLRFLGSWLLVVTGGGPTADKPDVSFAPPVDPRNVSHEMTIRVPDCRAAYDTLRARGAEFLTPPAESAWEVRCFFRDPDGHLLELSETKSAQ